MAGGDGRERGEARAREWVVEPAGAGQRLDAYLAAARLGLTRSHAQKLIRAGRVLVNGAAAKPGQRLRGGERLVVAVPAPIPPEARPEEIPLDVVYEDSDIIVVNKRRGMVVHPAPGHAGGTLVNALLAHCPDLNGINDVLRPGIVHRLDRDTSGLLVVAKNQEAYQSLARQLRNRTMQREYLALVHGQPPDEGVVEAPIGRHPLHRKRMAVLPEGRGRPALTRYRVLERFPSAGGLAVPGAGRGGGYALLAVRLETGRTHQIRVHMAHAGHPVAGDPVYGPRKNPLGLAGQALHAARLSLAHPRTGAAMTFTAPLPDDFAAALARLRRAVPGGPG